MNYHRLKWRIGLVVGVLAFIGLSFIAPPQAPNVIGQGWANWVIAFGYATWHLAKSKGRNPWWFLAGPIGMLVLGAQADRSHEVGLAPPLTLRDAMGRSDGDDSHAD